MTTYFSILPSELISDLSLYFNYRDTILACTFLKCDGINVWLTKINRELSYSNEFIRKYVYDKQNNVTKTLLPINEKYLELKARKGADFGTEFYNISIATDISSRLKNFELADQLTHYFLFIENAIFIDTSWTYFAALSGSLAVNNLQLFDKLLDKMPTEYRDLYDAVKNGLIVSAIYEKYPQGNDRLLKRFKINSDEIDERDIVTGLVIGNHFNELKKYSSQPNYNRLIYRNAEFITYYNIDKFLYETVAIEFGNEKLFDQIKFHPGYIEYGYLEELQKYDKSIIKNINSPRSIYKCLHNNHIDVIDYLYKLDKHTVINTIRENGHILYNATMTTINYLYKNSIFTKDELINLIKNPEIKTKMSLYNMDTYEYIQQLK